jgi:hypothetical protein
VRKDLKRDFIDNLNDQTDRIGEERKKLEKRFAQLSYWQDIYKEAHAKSDTKELLSVFSVLKRDQDDVNKFKSTIE